MATNQKIEGEPEQSGVARAEDDQSRPNDNTVPVEAYRSDQGVDHLDPDRHVMGRSRNVTLVIVTRRRK